MADISKVYNVIENHYQILLTLEEKRIITEKLSIIPNSVFRGYDTKTVLHSIIKLVEPIIKRRLISNKSHVNTKDSFISTPEELNEYQQTNISEVNYETPNYVDQLKQNEVEITSILGLNSTYQIQRLLNPSSLYEKHYLCLDSRYSKEAESKITPITSFSWSYASTANKMSGFTVNPGEIRNIIAIRLYQFYIPWDSTNTASFPELRHISILIHEFASQSMITHTQRKFHFLWPLLYTNYSTMGIEVYPENDDDCIYRFQKPILSFDNLTISFGDPYTLLNINHDRDTCTFTYGTSTTITTSINHGFIIGSTTWITITGFTTDAPITDIIRINSINNVYGIEVDVISVNTLRITNYNTTAITPTVGLTANIYYVRRRIISHLEFLCLKS